MNGYLNSLKILSNDTYNFEIFVVSFLDERRKLWIIGGMIRRGENEVVYQSQIPYRLVWM